MQIFGVGELAQYIRQYLGSNHVLRDVWVEGEIGTLTRASSGHYYFTVRDDRGQLPCVMFRSAAQSSGIQPQQGMAVNVHGEVSFYEPHGKLQLIVDLLYPAGLGTGQLLFEALRQKLEKEGLFASERKRALPQFPRRIGVVTSESGAALHDILTCIGRRYPIAEVVFAHSAVQGDFAPQELVEAIALIGWHHQNQAPIDVLIVGRGGGSTEDLAVFNHEAVARAIYRCPMPVVSAVGHELDVSIADLVADRRAPTPSAAAELVTPDRVELERHLALLLRRGAHRLQQRLEAARAQHRSMEHRLFAGSPMETARRRRQQIDMSLRSAAIALQNRIQVAREQVDGRVLQLTALSPRETLARGYAIAVVPGRGVITSASQAQPGDELQAIVHDGVIEARVTAARQERNNGGDPDLRREVRTTTGDDHRAGARGTASG
jgi:exodeoxyribonuclease VII large subunit